jgi:hypothetical protein
MSLIDYGDATVETKQVAPGIRPDAIFGFGVLSGSPEEDLDIAPFALVAGASESVGSSERAADA